MPKKYAELFLVGAFFILAVLLYSSTASYPNAVQGSTAAYVRFLGLSLGALCFLDLILTFLRSKKKETDDKKETFRLSTNPKPFWLLFILLLAYASIFSLLGFYISSALFLPITMLVLGARKPVSIILTTVGVLGFVYVVFETLLEVYMPVGSLIHW